MKFKILHFVLCYFSFFAFAKMSFAAVPIQAKSLKIEIAQDSILLDESTYLMREDSAKKTIYQWLRKARIVSNFAFACVPFFFLVFVLEEMGLYGLAEIAGFGSIFLGFILSVIALSLLLKVSKQLKLFPTIEKNETFHEKWIQSLVRTIAVSSFFTGFFLWIAFILISDTTDSGINSITFTAVFGLGLFALLDKFAFKTKK
jgi:hypothetical protein